MPQKHQDAFEIGSVVALKSGGPGLTVLGQAGDRVHCLFFSDELGDFRETMLPVTALAYAEIEDDQNENSEGDEDEEEDENEDNKNEDNKN